MRREREINKEVAQKTLDHILMNPDNHDQSTYWTGLTEEPSFEGTDNLCGTTACVAGTAAVIAGMVTWHKFVYPDGNRTFYSPEPRDHNWFCVGAEALGLTVDEADWLFLSSDNTQAVAALKKLANGESFLDEHGYVLTEVLDGEEVG